MALKTKKEEETVTVEAELVTDVIEPVQKEENAI